MIKAITSLQNPLIKQAALLLQKKHRKEQNAFLLEGLKNIYEAACSGFIIKSIFFVQAAFKENEQVLLEEILHKQNIELFDVTQEIIKKLSDTKTPQPIVAFLQGFSYDLSAIDLALDNPFILVLDGINNPGNLGTIIRTADAVGIQGVILNKNCADLLAPKTLRSTMGSVFHLPVIADCEDKKIVTWLKENSFQIAASAIDAKLTMQEADFSQRMAIVMGSEAHGISNYFSQNADFHVAIPMKGKAESLNVAIATALLLYNARS